ncbi:hypothetical protein H0H93_010162 [Arthromyces matolae]|nr:hypothetical protein H0H93_010162 [Arthromyces matolae]
MSEESQIDEHDPLLPAEHVESTQVYPIIHMIRRDMLLMAPDMTYTLVQPLVEKYTAIQNNGNCSVVFCFLLNRVRFLRDDNILTATISHSRATLCEILAIRTFRHYANSMLSLTRVLTTTWPVYNGADPHILEQAREERDDDLEDRVGNAIEMAILGKSKRFIKSSSCQKVINAIWSSVLHPSSPKHLLNKRQRKMCLPGGKQSFYPLGQLSHRDYLGTPEVLFMVYSLGFTLEKVAAMQEHGIKAALWARELGIDCLALIACLLFPRLAFVTLKENLMVLSVRAMISQFVVLMLIAAFCFGGFLYALWTLSQNEAGYSAGTIAWWMLDIWFGLDASGFDRSTQFHPYFGPILMVTYACLSNTLLLTVLVSILTNTFATINEDAAAEAMFRKAVSTIEGVKADFLFSYQPPINLIALCIMLPASYLLSPRWFHKVNVFMIRVTSFPILLMISLYERQSKKSGTSGFYETVSAVAERVYDTFPRHLKRLTFFEGLVGSDADISAIFEIEEEFESALDMTDAASYQQGERPRRMSGVGQPSQGTSAGPIPRARLNSIMVRGDSPQSFVSPLAQVYNPVAVGSIPEEPSDKVESPSPLPPSVTFTVNRRLSTTQQSMRTQQNPRRQSKVQMRRFLSLPVSSSPAQMPPSNTVEGAVENNVPKEPEPSNGRLEPTRSPERATQIFDENSAEHVEDEHILARRLDDIERRQERIEELLIQISRDLKH